MTKNCEDHLKKIDKEILPDEERKNLFRGLESAAKTKSGRAEVERIRKEFVDRKRKEVSIKHLDKLIRAVKVADAVDHASRFNDKFNGILSFFEGRYNAVKGASYSVDARGKVVEQRYLNAFLREMRNAKVWETWNDKTLEEKLAQQLGNTEFKYDDDNIYKLSNIINNVFEAQAKRLEAANAPIERLDNWISHQVHNADLMLKTSENYAERRKIEKQLKQKHGNNLDAINKERFELAKGSWKKFVREHIDEARTFTGEKASYFERTKGLQGGELNAEIDNILDGIYDEITGYKSVSKGSANIREKFNAQRKLHFLDGRSWVKYNKRYGSGDIYSAVVASMLRNSKAINLTETMGLNPRQFFDDYLKTMEKQFPGYSLGKRSWRAEASFNEIVKQYDNPQYMGFSQIMGSLRDAQSIAHLGGITVNSIFPDVSNAFAQFRLNGIGLVDSIKNAASLLLPMGQEERRVIGSSIEDYASALLPSYRKATIGSDGPAGAFSKAASKFFNLTGIHHWDAHLRKAWSVQVARELGSQIDKSFDGLTDFTKLQLERYNFGSDEWDLFRDSKEFMKGYKGKYYLTPDLIERIPDKNMAAYVSKVDERFNSLKGEARQSKIDDYRNALDMQLRTYFSDMTESVQYTKQATVSLKARLYAQPTSLAGQIWKSLMQFKEYPLSYVRNTLGKALFQNGEDGIFKALATNTSFYRYMSELLVAGTAVGYAKLAAFSLITGEVPDPMKAETWLKSFWEGSPFGLYSDIIHTMSWAGNHVVEALEGPTVKLANQTSAALVKSVKNAFIPNNPGESTLSLWTKYAHDNFLPNLWFAKDAFDKMFYASIMDNIDPAYARRLRKKFEERSQNNIKLIG